MDFLKPLLLLALLVLSSPASSEGLYITVGAGKNFNAFPTATDWEDAGGIGAYIAAKYRFNKQLWCFDCVPSVQYTHLSQWDKGCPQDCGGNESAVDHLGIALTWKVF